MDVLIKATQTATTVLGQSRVGSKNNEKVLDISKGSRMKALQ